MLQSEEHGVVVGGAIVAVEVHAVDERVERKPLSYSRNVGVGLDDDVTRYAALIAQCGYELMAQSGLRRPKSRLTVL
jgi:hypothetical protein